MTEEKGLFKEDNRAEFYAKILLIGKKMNLILLYFSIVMNVMVIVMMWIGETTVGVFYFLLNTWFLFILRSKIKKEKIDV